MQRAERSKDPAGLYREARALGHLGKNNGLFRKPLTDNPLAQPAHLAAHFQQVLNISRPTAPDLLRSIAPVELALPAEHLGGTFAGACSTVHR